MTDRLDAIEAGLRDGRYDCRVPGDTDDVRWLVAEVRRLRGELSAAEYHRDGARATIEQLERDLAALRSRYDEAVKRAWDEAWDAAQDYDRDMEGGPTARYAVGRNAAWLASEAKARLT